MPSPFRTISQASPPPSPPPPAAAAAPAATACTRDEQCPSGTICDQGVCRKFERSVSALIYHSQPGNPGYRVVAPFYWHFWSPQSRTKIVFPFYWRFEDHLSKRVVTVIPPFAHTRQPDATSFAVWPLFYASSKFGWAAPLFGSFKVGNPDKGRALGLYGFLYFWKRAPGSAFDLFFPLFVSKRSEGGAFTWALPLNFYWRNGGDKRLLVFPLFYRGWNEREGTLVSLLGYRSRSGDSTRGAVGWLYWYGRSPQKSHDFLFPLLWSFRSPTSNTTVVPPVVYVRRGDWSLGTVAGVAWWANDRAKRATWKLVVPLFFSRTRNDGRSSMWLTPLGGYRRDDDAGSRALTFVVPPLFRRRSPDREFDSYLLLYWRYRNFAEGSTTTVVGPIYRRDDPQGSTRVGFPLFWYFRDSATGATAHTLLPLYFRRSGPDETMTAIGPAYWRRFTAGGGSAGLFPIAFFGSRDDRRHAVVFPLFWHFKNARSSSTVAFPLFYRFADRTSSAAGAPPLLYFQGHDHQESYRFQIPFFWRFVDRREGTATTVVPPLYWKSRRDGWSAGLAPLLFAGGGGPRRHFVLAPLLWHFRDAEKDRTTTVVLNYMRRRHGAERTDALFPILHWRRGARPGGQPESSFTLFPLVHYRRDAWTTTFVSPLAAWGRGPHRKGGMVLPYFWYASRNFAVRGVPPLWFDFTRLATSERTRVFGPLVLLDAPGSKSRTLFPLFTRYSNEKEWGTYVFPTYLRRRTHAGYALDALLPLFWHSTSPEHTTTVVGPWFRRVGTGRYSTGLPPLYIYASNAERRWLVTPLLVHHRNFKEDRSRTWALLYWNTTRPQGSTTVVFPLWWSGREKGRTHRVLFPLYWHFADKDAQEPKSFSLAGPFLWSREGTRRTRGIMPLAWYTRDDEKRWGSNALLPLFYERHGPNQKLFVTALFGYKSAVDRSWWYAGPFLLRDSWRSSFAMLFPVWFGHHDKVSDTRTRVIPPLLHFARTSPERSLWSAGLVFWRHRDITSSTTLALPLFFDVHNYKERRLTMLLPLFFRHRSDVTGQTYTIAPLFYRRKGPADSTTVAFPLFWDFNGGERRTTVLFPFYVGVRRPTFVARYIFPTIYVRKGLGAEAGTSRFAIFPLWDSRVKRPGDYQWEVLLGLLGGERIGRNRYFKLFFIPFELDPAPAAAQTAAWYGKPPARRERVRQLRAQVW